MDEDIVSLGSIEFHSEKEPYRDHIYSYQRGSGLTEALRTKRGVKHDSMK